MAIGGHTAIDVKVTTRQRLVTLGARRNSVSYDSVINKLCDFFESQNNSQPFMIPAEAQTDFLTALRNMVDSITMVEVEPEVEK